MFRSIVILLSVFNSAILADYCPSVTTSRIQECVAPVAEYAKVLNNGNVGGLIQEKGRSSELGSAFSLPNMGGRVFNELCKLIAKFNVCVRDHRVRCPKHVTISLIDSSYGYLCNEGYNTFMESAECLMELDRRPSVKKCHDETLSEIEGANTEIGISMAAKLDRMCGALNFFSGCVRTPIKRDCGASAWQVIYRVLKDTTNTLMPGCQFTGTSAKLLTMSTEPPEETTTMIATTTESTTMFDIIEETTTLPSRKSMRKNIINSELTQPNPNTSSHLSTYLILTLLLFTL